MSVLLTSCASVEPFSALQSDVPDLRGVQLVIGTDKSPEGAATFILVNGSKLEILYLASDNETPVYGFQKYVKGDWADSEDVAWCANGLHFGRLASGSEVRFSVGVPKGTRRLGVTIRRSRGSDDDVPLWSPPFNERRI